MQWPMDGRMARPLRVFVVDDSRTFRSIVSQAIRSIDGMEKVGSAGEGDLAISYLRHHDVDLVTLDVEMPGKDGLATLREINKMKAETGKIFHVVMVSSHTSEGAPATIEALAEGAFDFIEKPKSNDIQSSMDALVDALSGVARACAQQKVAKTHAKSECSRPSVKLPQQSKFTQAAKKSQQPVPYSGTFSHILIGCSTGGPKALTELLPSLTKQVDLPILIVQHMPEGFTRSLAENLDRRCSAKIVEAADGMTIENGHVYIAPGGKHMVIRKNPSGAYMCGTNDGPTENGCRPAVDVLFRNAAPLIGDSTLAIILTGMGEDGFRGLRTLKRQGAIGIAQDEESSVVWGMPGSAVAAGVVDKVVSLRDMAELVTMTIGATHA